MLRTPLELAADHAVGPKRGEVSRSSLSAIDLGRAGHDEVHQLQLQLVERRAEDEIGDVLLLVEHEPVITLGRRGDEKHILASAPALEREGIAVRHIERGGDVTYHGPGQLVGYPILDLRALGLGPSDYMHILEEAILRTLSDWGLDGRRREGTIGVWIGEAKIAALGVRIRRGISYHGFALNVSPNMRHWELIVPCGIADGGVTSMALEMGSAPDLPKVAERLVFHFGRLFHMSPVHTTVDSLAWRTELQGNALLWTD